MIYGQIPLKSIYTKYYTSLQYEILYNTASMYPTGKYCTILYNTYNNISLIFSSIVQYFTMLLMYHNIVHLIVTHQFAA